MPLEGILIFMVQHSEVSMRVRTEIVGLFTLALALVALHAEAQIPLYLSNDQTQVRKITFLFETEERGTRPALSPAEIKTGAQMASHAPTWIDRLMRLNPLAGRTYFPLVPIEVQKDVVRIRRFYESQGFLNARIDYAASQLDTARNRIHLIFSIHEGPPLEVGHVRYENDSGELLRDVLDGESTQRKFDRLLLELPLQPGNRFTRFDFALAKGQVLDWMRDQGYAFATVNADSLLRREENRIDLVYRVAPGPIAYVDSVIVEGNTKVSRRVVRRESVLQPGDRFSQRKLVEGQRALFGMNIFRLATADLPVQEVDSTVSIRYQVREARLRRIQAETGYAREDGVVVRGSWTHRNFLGDARQLTFASEWRSGFQAVLPANIDPVKRLNLSVTVRQPYLWRRNLSASFTNFYNRESNPNQDAYYQEVGVNASSFYQFLPFRTVSLNYTFARAFPLSDGDELQGRDAYNRSVLSWGGTFGRVNDFFRRDRGFLIRPSAEVAGVFVPGSGVEYVNLSNEIVGYIPLTGAVNLASRLFVGRLFPLGNSKDQQDPTTRYRFVRIRYYAGGNDDVRGWQLQQLGPQRAIPRVRPDNDPAPDPALPPYRDFRLEGVGGTAKIAGGLEARFPFFLGSMWRSAAFLDFGQITQGSLSPRNVQFGTGGGIRYDTPVGFLRMDIGFKLNPSDDDLYTPEGLFCRREGFAQGDACFAQTGDPGNPSFARRFALHLSIGQSF